MKKDEIEKRFNAIATEYDAQRRELIPCFDEFYATIISASEAGLQSPKVLDVGAGTGLLSSFFLEENPTAQIALIDISKEMLQKAKERFKSKDTISYIEADYAKFVFEEKYDLIISSLSIHHLEDSEKKLLYTSLYNALKPGGLFINGDQFHGRSAKTEKRNQEWWRRTIEETSLTDKEIAGWEERVKMDLPATVDDNCIWLEEAGFKEVDCIYKMYNFGIIIGRKE